MQHFLLFQNATKDPENRILRQVCTVLLHAGGKVYVPEDRRAVLSDLPVQYYDATEALPAGVELILTIGGDGTVLEASRLAIARGIPLLGINCGRRGYLAAVEQEDIPSLARLCHETFAKEERMTLSVTHHAATGDVLLPCAVVNDVVFYRASLGHAVELTLSRARVPGGLSYLADGLILATPTGTTAYSLSAGGPVLSSGSEAICATPICPHTFFDRSVVFDGRDAVQVHNTARQDGMAVTLDGKETFSLLPGEYVTVQKGPAPLRMLCFDTTDFLAVLQKKMKVTE